MRRLLFIGLFFGLSPTLLFAQTVEHSSWATLYNNTKFNAKWGMQFDIQLRSANEYKYLKTLLIRPAIIYNVSKTTNLGLGYVLLDNYTNNNGPNITENHIFEQFIHIQAIKAISLTYRVRLEQRFIESPGSVDIFSQRFRYMERAMIPLAKQKATFKKGVYAVIQDEILLNVQNKNELNGSLFDQNRGSANIGYRFSPKLDIEAGYMNQFVKRVTGNVSNNVAQIAFYTRF